MKYTFLFIALIGLAIAGLSCSTGQTGPATQTVTQTPASGGDNPLTVVAQPEVSPTKVVKLNEYIPPVDQSWLSPGKVEIGNFHSGARAEWNITVHNGNEYTTESKMVVTGENETEADIPVNQMVFGDGIGTRLISDNSKDGLELVEVCLDKKALRISGFNPDDKRTLTITYKYYALFNIGPKIPEKAMVGFVKAPIETQDWIIITKPKIVMAPYETREIPISIEMPEDIKDGSFPPNWEFWISVIDASQKGVVNIELCSRWLIKMRT